MKSDDTGCGGYSSKLSITLAGAFKGDMVMCDGPNDTSEKITIGEIENLYFTRMNTSGCKTSGK